jgi:lysophospholipase L1-like esterase
MSYWPEVFPSTFRNYVDAGVDGNTSDSLLARFNKDVLELHPQVVHILIGTNDVIDNATYGSIPLATTEENINTMAAMAERSGVRVVVGTVTPVVASYPRADDINSEIVSLNEWIRATSEQQHWKIVGYYSLLEVNGALGVGYSIDGKLHLNKTAYDKISPHTLAALEDN